VVRAEDSRPRGRGFVSRRILYNLLASTLKKIENKGSQMRRTKKKKKYIYNINQCIKLTNG
jgi:hypothetical protein